jgi:hypothetical protein
MVSGDADLLALGLGVAAPREIAEGLRVHLAPLLDIAGQEGGCLYSSGLKRGTISTSTRWSATPSIMHSRRRGYRFRAQLQPADHAQGPELF